MNYFLNISARYFLYIGLLISNKCVAQTTEYRFSVKNENAKPVKNLFIFLNGEQVKTNEAGLIFISFNNTIHQVDVSLDSSVKYSIVSPINGILNLPLNPKDINYITVTDKSNTDNQNLANKIVGLQKKLDKLSNDNTAERLNLNKQLIELLKQGKKNKLSESQLRTARELVAGRDSCFPIISSTLNNYISQAKDVHDAFKYMVSSAMEKQEAFTAMKKTVTIYNATYQEWNEQKSNYEKSIRDFWQSTELALKYQNLTDYALNEVHRTYILGLNGLLEKISLYGSEKNTKKRREMKEQILSAINENLPGLNSRNQVLGEKINSFIQILNSDIIIK